VLQTVLAFSIRKSRGADSGFASKTHFKGRAESLGDRGGRRSGTLVNGRAGNYLIYFPFVSISQRNTPSFSNTLSIGPGAGSTSGMTEPERDAFSRRLLRRAWRKRSSAFAVLGGIFGEGIDLVGEQLIGAVIVGVGLPQLCIERNLIRDYFQKQNAAGFEYAYTFPGMNACCKPWPGHPVRHRSRCRAAD